jgi:YVTN family beta-propeller protein
MLPEPAYLETNNTTAQLNVLRYKPDDGSLLRRPFITNERVIPLTVNATGSNSRGVVIDSTPRLGPTCAIYSASDPRSITCAQQTPANLYIANRTPPSLIIGQVGVPNYPIADTAYDPDSISVFNSVPLPAGPSNVYLAPIVDADGNYSLRVFVVEFDSNAISIYNPATQSVERQVPMSDGPFAMAFDPFPLDQVALGTQVPLDARHPDAPGAQYPLQLKTYRFAYVASFTNSYLQVIDLDDSRSDKSTFETVVFTLGSPTLPKGTQQNNE